MVYACVSLIAWCDVFDEVDLCSGLSSFPRNALPAINPKKQSLNYNNTALVNMTYKISSSPVIHVS